METGPWQSVEACLAALSGILDAGGYARADAYAYIYGRLEATADLEETPAELRGVVGAQHGPTLVQHIARALRAAVPSPVEHAEQASKYLPLLTVLLSHECCCRALDAQPPEQQQPQPGGGGAGAATAAGGAAAGGVLDTLLDVLLAGQEKLVAVAPPAAAPAGPSTGAASVNSPPPSSAAGTCGGNPFPLPAPHASASTSSSVGSSTPLAEREARALRLPLADLCLHLLDALAYQRCDLSRLPDLVLLKLLRALMLAVAGGFGPLCPSLPAQGLHATIRLLPRVAPLPSAAARSRGLLKAILRRALAVPNVAEAGMAVDALRGAVQAGLLRRDPMGSGAAAEKAESYHCCVTGHWDKEAYGRLKAAEPITALRLTGVLVQLLDPSDSSTRPIMAVLWTTIQAFMDDKSGADGVRTLQREAMTIWSAYVTALASQWPSIPAKRRNDSKSSLRDVIRFLPMPIAYFLRTQRAPSEGTMEVELQVLALLNTLLATTDWRELLWEAQPPQPAAGGGRRQQGQRQPQQQQVDLRRIVLFLLRTDHGGEAADLGTLRFDAGLVCLAELVPGAVPRALLLLQGDTCLRGWRPVAPLDHARQLSLLSAAIPILAKQKAVLRHFQLEAEAAAARRLQQQQQQSQSQPPEGADAAATMTAAAQQPSLEQRPPALRPLLACWADLLQRLLPAALTATASAAAATVDGALDVLCQHTSKSKPAQLAALQLLADEALRILGPSPLVVPPGSALWAAVTSKVYTAPPADASGGHDVRLGTLALGLKALLLHREACGAEGDEAKGGVKGGGTTKAPAATATPATPATPLRLSVGDGDLALPQLVDFLDGLLARLTATPATAAATTTPVVVLPRPWLRVYYACLAHLLALSPKQAHALTLRVLAMLPTFAAHGGAAATFPSPAALHAEAGGPVLELWANLLNRCLTWAEAPHAHSHAAGAGASQSQSQFAEWAVDPAQAVAAVADTVLGPLLPPTAAPSSSRARAALWCPLAWKALRCLNTSLNTRGGSGGGKGAGSAEAQRIRAALLAPALRLGTALLSALQGATAPGRNASVCVCNACGPAASSGGGSGGSSSNTWLYICLRPTPAAEEWTLEAVQAMAQALVAWWSGSGSGDGASAAAGACRKALAKEAAEVTRRFLDSLQGGGGGGKGGGGGARQSLCGGGAAAAAAAQGLLQAAPGQALLALQPLLLALLAGGGDEGKARVQVLWQGAGLGKRADLGLAGDGARALRGALQQLVRLGAIASRDPALAGNGGEGADAGGLAVAGNGNGGSSGGGGGRRPSSSGGSAGGSPAVKKRLASSSSSLSGAAAGGAGGGGGGAAAGASASKRAKG